MKILCALLCLFFVTTGMRAYAAVAIVEDNAGLLTGQEIQQLKAHAESVSSSRKCDVMLITTADTNGKSSGRYAEDYFLKNCTGDDGFVLIIDMDNREINVHTRFDKLRGNDADRFPGRQLRPDLRNYARSVFATHECGEMNCSARHPVVQFPAVLSGVHHAQYLIEVGQFACDFIPCPANVPIRWKFDLCAFQALV